MPEFSFLPNADTGGVTTSSNAVVGATSAVLPVKGPFVLVSAGVQPIFIRFGKANTGVVTTSNGLRLPANSITTLSVPSGANSLLHIREASTDSTISVQTGVSGT